MIRQVVHPVDLEADGLCCCLACHRLARAIDLHGLYPIRPEVRRPLLLRWPDLLPNLFDETPSGTHQCS